jgi:hypothetical protein
MAGLSGVHKRLDYKTRRLKLWRSEICGNCRERCCGTNQYTCIWVVEVALMANFCHERELESPPPQQNILQVIKGSRPLKRFKNPQCLIRFIVAMTVQEIPLEVCRYTKNLKLKNNVLYCPYLRGLKLRQMSLKEEIFGPTRPPASTLKLPPRGYARSCAEELALFKKSQIVFMAGNN